MTAAKLIEHRIIRNVIRRRESGATHQLSGLADQLITAAAITAGLLLLGSYLQELMWVLLGAGVVLTLGTRTP